MYQSELPPERWLLIACTLRSGSNLLCETLERAGLAKPTEYFQESRYKNSSNPLRREAQERLPDAWKLYEAVRDGQAGLPWRGVKWNWSQFATATRELERLGAPVGECFPNATWVKLSRRRKTEQAVSLYLAQRTGVWVAGDRPTVNEALAYDRQAVSACFNEIVVEEALWERFFREQGIRPLRLYYEDFIEAPLAEVGRLLGVSVDEEIAAPCKNQPTTSAANHAILAEFERDLLTGAGCGGAERADELLAKVNALAETVGYRDVIAQLACHPPGAYPTIRKIDLRNHPGFRGAVDVVEGPHFRDLVGFRMAPESSFELAFDGCSLLLELLAHPWSGYVDLDFGDETQTVDLYHSTTSFRPVLKTWPSVAPRSLRIIPHPRQNALALGSEVWLQRLWLMS